MFYFDTNHRAMADMNLSEKVRINVKAMQDAKLFKTTKFILLVSFFTLLSVVVAAFAWVTTQYAIASLLGILLVTCTGMLVSNLIFRSQYSPFIGEALKHKEDVLGDEAQRLAHNKKQKDHFAILAFFIPVSLLVIFIVL